MVSRPRLHVQPALATLICVVTFSTLAAGQFETRGTFAANPSPSSIAVGDFNRDGQMDLAVAAGGSTTDDVSILLGNGDGTFRTTIY
jgi:FG-GAP repeat protein